MAFVASHLQDQAELDRMMRQMRFRRSSQAYHGEFPQPLKVRTGQPNDNTSINFAKIVVDCAVSYLFGKEPQFELDETADTEAEAWLEEAWRINRKQIKLHNLALNGAVYGHTFVKLVPAQPHPRLIVLDPGTVDVFWDIEDIERVVRFEVSYGAIDPYSKKPVAVRQLVERQNATWVITDQRGEPDSEEWVTIAVTDWPYAWSPIFHCQNLPAPNEFWGVGDIENDVLDLNERINFLMSNLHKIIRYHAHPRTWGTGFDASDIKMAVDDIVVLPDGAELHELEMQSDLGSSIELYKRLREALHELARVPEVATGKVDSVGALSGVALEILFAPLLQKTETKRSLYGEMLIAVNKAMLELGGFGEENVTTIHWPELLPSDPLAERKALQIDSTLGASNDTILQKLGYDADLEREKKAAQQPPLSVASSHPADSVVVDTTSVTE